MSSMRTLLAAATISVAGFTAEALAAPVVGDTNTYAMSVSAGGPVPAGTVTVLQTAVGATNEVKVTYALPSGWGLINTGGPKTPFTFNLAPAVTGAVYTFVMPAGGTFIAGGGPAVPGDSTLSTGGSDSQANPIGTFTNSIQSDAGNGSANGYFGSLVFTVSAIGVNVNSFLANANGYYFGADVSNNRNSGSTGSVGANTVTFTPGNPVPPPIPPIPEPATMALLGAGLLGLGAVRRRRQAR